MKYVHSECLNMSRQRKKYGTLYKCDICYADFEVIYRVWPLELFHQLSDEFLAIAILLLIPVAIYSHNLSIGFNVSLVVVLLTWISVNLDAQYSTVAALKKAKSKRWFEMFLTYMFIMEIELGMIIAVESTVLM
jgi:hypothetical protein